MHEISAWSDIELYLLLDSRYTWDIFFSYSFFCHGFFDSFILGHTGPRDVERRPLAHTAGNTVDDAIMSLPSLLLCSANEL